MATRASKTTKVTTEIQQEIMPTEATDNTQPLEQTSAIVLEADETQADAAEDAPGALLQLPSTDSPIVGSEAIRSYKTAFGRVNPSDEGKPANWIVSDDNGVTNEDSKISTLVGIPLDMLLLVTPAGENADYTANARFRFLLQGLDGTPFMVNLNSLATTSSGIDYVPATAKSLISNLMTISRNVDETKRFANACRIDLTYGKKTRFINLSGVTPDNKGWSRLGFRADAVAAPDTIEDLFIAVKAIKQRFQAAGIMASGSAAVAGENVYFEATGKTATTSVVDALATTLDNAGF